MYVPYRLERDAPEAATALLLLSHDSADLLTLCAQLAFDPLPTIRMVADGYLLSLSAPIDDVVPGCVRLKQLSPNLLIPADATLIPALRDEEARDLSDKRGLIFLPGLRVLAFAIDKPLSLSELLELSLPKRSGWLALPHVSILADNINEITLESPDDTPEEFLQQGNEEIGSEPNEHDDASLPKQALGKTLMGLGKGMAWIGKSLGMKGLAGLGAKAMSGALNLAPKLGESLMGKRELALQALLNEFRKGNVEKALRRALPLSNDPGWGSSTYQGTNLPTHNLYFSLIRLLGSSSGGTGGTWFTGDNTYFELQREYRKQAELATSRGDFRRAAFIYGMLLRDFANAAKVLARGGLHREAAIIYLKKLKDHFGAAREFEAAGEIDQAVALYIQIGDHAQAGDLLRRAGDEDRALDHYRLAADKLAEKNDHFRAGELFRVRAGRRDLAIAYYQIGWRNRSFNCALQLGEYYADESRREEFIGLFADIESDKGDDSIRYSTAQMLNRFAELTKRPGLKPIAEDIQDRALLALARKLSSGIGQHTVSTTFPPSSVWSAPLVNDARQAHANRSNAKPTLRAPDVIKLCNKPAVVTAVVQASATGELFVGFEHGEIIAFNPAKPEPCSIYLYYSPITSLAVDPGGDYLVALSQREHKGCISSFTRATGYRMHSYQIIETGENPWLCTQVISHSANRDQLRGTQIVVWTGRRWQIHNLPYLPVMFGSDPDPETTPHALVHFVDPQTGSTMFVEFSGRTIRIFDSFQAKIFSGAVAPISEGPWNVDFTTQKFATPLLSWCLGEGGRLFLVGMLADKTAYQATIDYGSRSTRTATGITLHTPAQATTIIRPGLTAAVDATGVHWIKIPGLKTFTKITLPDSTACFVSHVTGELLVLSEGGEISRVPLPKV